MNRGREKGDRAERRCRDWLRDMGYTVTRAAGSFGPVDLVAWNDHELLVISVKAGTARLSRAERATLAALVMPPMGHVEYWRVMDYARAPIIERIA